MKGWKANERVHAALLDPKQGERDWELVPVPLHQLWKQQRERHFDFIFAIIYLRGFIIKMLFQNDVTSWFLGYSNLFGFQNVY